MRHISQGYSPLLVVPFSIFSDPDWASSTLGVFICLSCSGIHRNIPSISKVKSLKMDYWDDAQVQVRSLSPWVGQVVWTRLYTQCPGKISPLTSQSWNVIWFNQCLFYSGKSGITPHNPLGEGGHTCLMCLCMSCYFIANAELLQWILLRLRVFVASDYLFSICQDHPALTSPLDFSSPRAKSWAILQEKFPYIIQSLEKNGTYENLTSSCYSPLNSPLFRRLKIFSGDPKRIICVLLLFGRGWNVLPDTIAELLLNSPRDVGHGSKSTECVRTQPYGSDIYGTLLIQVQSL